ncbi:hypothetical protein [Micromonospora mirobrigensis]|uniref:Uncharacterized protein n=1 Tax=Micromonospora mirobrigensis TaxID=262898 RepID=A0A1C4Y1C7_9ACTN|nr:hypothetical protein [Micromonospora mirobrigensis]SCF14201.1 hypothetical protein GA0070564_103463 [Micromonospora mirobrigensis]
MRVFERLSAVAVALAFVLAGLGAPACAETHQPGAVVTAAHRSIVHDASHVPDGDARRVDAAVTTSSRTTPATGDPRAVVDRLARPGAPSELREGARGGPCGDHRAGVATGDGPDDPLLGPPVCAGGPPVAAVAAPRYRAPAVPLPPRGTLPSRAPPAA